MLHTKHSVSSSKGSNVKYNQQGHGYEALYDGTGSSMHKGEASNARMVSQQMTAATCNCSARWWLIRPSRLAALALCTLVAVSLGLHYVIAKSGGSSSPEEASGTAAEGEDHLSRTLAQLSGMHCTSLRDRVDELLKIKASVLVELRELEQQRGQVQEAVSRANTRLTALRQEETRMNTELDRLKSSVDQAIIAQKELFEKNMPDIIAPRRITATHEDNVVLQALSHAQVESCRMFNCFDHSRCSLLSGFPVFVYDTDKYQISPQPLDTFIKTTVRQALGYNPHVTRQPEEACVFVAIVGEMAFSGVQLDKQLLESNLHSLPYWNGDGRNHVLLNLARTLYSTDVFSGVNTGRAMVVQAQMPRSQYRHGFDLVSSVLLGLPGGDLWRNLPPLVPAKRTYLLSFQGELPALRPYLSAAGAAAASSQNADTIVAAADGAGADNASKIISKAFVVADFSSNSWSSNRSSGGSRGGNRNVSSILQNHSLVAEVAVVESLSHLHHTTTSDSFLVQFSCQGAGGAAGEEDWQLCGGEDYRAEVLQMSTFSLILTPPSSTLVSSVGVVSRLFESLKHGAVPVILGGDAMQLPLSEVLDWSNIAIVLPKARVSELHFLLRSYSDADVLLLRRQGRLVWERYLGSSQAQLDALLSVIRTRLLIPPLSALHEPSPSVFEQNFTPLQTDTIIPEPDTDENLGPMEPPFPSPRYQRNFSVSSIGRYHQWNVWAVPGQLYPNLPHDPILPSEAKFAGSQVGFRPIGSGSGGSGKEFSESLGGNVPREQFTIVMLTFEREQVLINSLARLYGLPYLNKVLVIWNSPKPPPPDLRWPDIKVPIEVIRAERNSLNNRFLPYSEIETEAVLSVDDDAHLRHDEIVFGFRVWREERERVVGFPGRYHAWDLKHDAWLYNSNYSCQLSMVLTGAAFFHKSYSFLYSQVMPQAIRDKVDEYMNCEDIAMNFLVSHMTRKPPVKVTSRWTFRCPGCPVSLSEDDSHFTERHHCINFFTQVYGYNPLLNTQYRVDSVLFKTRLPHDKQKCFKFI
uniref:glucuronosyl-galactosyl-proteoglycan 4-alpha-N-acetylglucosaminyltransferase n=3 Tax=Hirondellea gigas TaxID=1518452 RepID=A0A6A7FTA7_9CRUS